MSNFLLLGICLFAGMILRESRRLPKDTPAVLNGFIFHISLPALVLVQFHNLVLSSQAFWVASAAWALFAMSAVVFLGLSRVVRWDKKTLGALILTTGLANTSFVGFPMLEALYGPGSLKVALMVDQLGSFLVVSSLGIGLASYFSARNISLGLMARRIFSFPPIYALLIACFSRPVPFPDFLTDLLNRLGSTLTPLALVSTGYQLRLEFKLIQRNARELFLGLLFKLVLGPAVLAGFYLYYLHLGSEAARITILETAMAPMITSAIVVSEYELDSELANLMVGIGIPLSFLTVPLWAWILP